MKLQKLTLNFLTLGSIGYLHAPGTIATLFSLIFVYLFYLSGITNYLILTLVFAITAFIAITITKFKGSDPSEIVIDELIGCLVTFAGIKLNLKSIILGFIFFRLFDITKPFGIKRLEKIKGATGILIDDIAAGLISNILLQFFVC